MNQVESKFSSHKFEEKVNGQLLSYRVLKMQDSLFVYIGNAENETFDGMGTAFMSKQTKEVVGTSILSGDNAESQDLAQKLTARLNKTVFVSSNTNLDRITRPAIEQRLIQEIKEFPDYF